MFRTTKPYYITMGIAVLAMIVCIIIGGMSSKKYDKEIAANEAQISNLNNQIAVQSATISAGNAQTVKTSMGIDLQRVVEDDAVAKVLIEKMVTWSSAEEYNNARTYVTDTFGLNPKSNVLRTFFPELPIPQESPSSNYIDYNNLSCRFKGMKSMVRAISGEQYSYFTIVTCEGNKNGATGSFNVAMMYTVDANGAVSGLDAYTLDGHTWVG